MRWARLSRQAAASPTPVKSLVDLPAALHGGSTRNLVTHLGGREFRAGRQDAQRRTRPPAVVHGGGTADLVNLLSGRDHTVTHCGASVEVHQVSLSRIDLRHAPLADMTALRWARLSRRAATSPAAAWESGILPTTSPSSHLSGKEPETATCAEVPAFRGDRQGRQAAAPPTAARESGVLPTNRACTSSSNDSKKRGSLSQPRSSRAVEGLGLRVACVPVVERVLGHVALPHFASLGGPTSMGRSPRDPAAEALPFAEPVGLHAVPASGGPLGDLGLLAAATAEEEGVPAVLAHAHPDVVHRRGVL